MSRGSMVILGVYRVPVTDELFRECMDWWYGYDMPELKRRQADRQCWDQLAALRLFEVELRRDQGNFDFGTITQEVEGRPEANWQVPYDEQKLEDTQSGSRWVFFFHYLDSRKPLLTPFGLLEVPPPGELSPELSGIKYSPL